MYISSGIEVHFLTIIRSQLGDKSFVSRVVAFFEEKTWRVTKNDRLSMRLCVVSIPMCFFNALFFSATVRNPQSRITSQCSFPLLLGFGDDRVFILI